MDAQLITVAPGQCTRAAPGVPAASAKAHRRQVRRLAAHVICITVSGLLALWCVLDHRPDTQLAMLPLSGNLVQEVLDLIFGLA